MNIDSIYNEVLTEYYGLNCNCKSGNINSFWVDVLIKDLNINNKWEVQLQTLFQ